MTPGTVYHIQKLNSKIFLQKHHPAQKVENSVKQSTYKVSIGQIWKWSEFAKFPLTKSVNEDKNTSIVCSRNEEVIYFAEKEHPTFPQYTLSLLYHHHHPVRLHQISNFESFVLFIFFFTFLEIHNPVFVFICAERLTPRLHPQELLALWLLCVFGQWYTEREDKKVGRKRSMY